MKRAFQTWLLVIIATFATMAFASRSNALTIIDFDDCTLTDHTLIGSYYDSIYDVYIIGNLLKVWNTAYIPADPGNYKSYAKDYVFYGVNFDGYTISRFEWDMVTYPLDDPTIVRVYDSTGNELYNTTVSSSSGFGSYMTHHVLDFDSLGIADQVASVRLYESTNRYIIDNIAFERYNPSPPPAPVPEPATILLMGAGLAGFGVASRKRHHGHKR